MTTQKKRAATPGGGGSRASKNGKPRTFKFRGIDLVAPKKIPDTIGFDLGDIQARVAEGDEGAVMGKIQRLLEDLLGYEELQKVRPTVKGIEDVWQQELIEKVLSLEGLKLGEA